MGPPRRRRVLRQGSVQGGPFGSVCDALGSQELVAAGLAQRVEVQVAYAIGKAAPVGLFVETFGTETVDPARIEKAITSVFDLRPGAIIRDLDLLRPIYAQTAAYGHFGRTDIELPWEQTRQGRRAEGFCLTTTAGRGTSPAEESGAANTV